MTGPAHVLVVEESTAIGMALERRLTGCAVLRHADTAHLPADRRGWGAYDVVIVCPYVAAPARTGIVAAVARAGRRPTLVLLHDRHEAGVEVASGGDPVAPEVRAVLAALRE